MQLTEPYPGFFFEICFTQGFLSGKGGVHKKRIKSLYINPFFYVYESDKSFFGVVRLGSNSPTLTPLDTALAINVIVSYFILSLFCYR